jgi:hypothetical protein
VLKNDRKIGLIEETAHGLQYAPGSMRTPVIVKRKPGDLNGLIFWWCGREDSNLRPSV